jgi:hypothetical protein
LEELAIKPLRNVWAFNAPTTVLVEATVWDNRAGAVRLPTTVEVEATAPLRDWTTVG